MTKEENHLTQKLCLDLFAQAYNLKYKIKTNKKIPNEATVILYYKKHKLSTWLFVSPYKIDFNQPINYTYFKSLFKGLEQSISHIDKNYLKE